MPVSTLDHIVVTAPNLKSGVEWVRATLGATPEFGGMHPRMGTHNCLLSLGDQTYLEVIAPDPNAPKPDRPRWFELDSLNRDSPPRLAAWIARTTDIEATVAASSEPLGVVAPMSRGELNWLITVTEDGALPLGGIAPILIEWHTPTHPSANMRGADCQLLRLELKHPEAERVESLLLSIGLEGKVDVIALPTGSAPSLSASIQTAQGIRTLSTV
jgi:hypothetical protein